MRLIGVCWCAALLAFATACASEPPPAAPAITLADTTVAVAEPTPVSTTTSELGASTIATASTTTAPGTTAAGGVVPEGFERIAATVTTADGEVCELCLWLAASGDQRQRGLMFVTDLGDADGMAFRYESPHSGSFWMKNTLLPLSIGFYDADGEWLDAFDMDPCTADPCPTYPTPNGFLVAIETSQGNLAELGIEAGSTLALTDLPCP